jgi:tellurite resistance protein
VDEKLALNGALRSLSGDHLSRGAVARMLARFEERVEAVGHAARLELVAATLSADRLSAESAFSLAAVMVIADVAVNADEQHLLEELATLLGISRRRAGELLADPSPSSEAPPRA